ncbi:MAG TPA: exosortase H [Candidatus Polarisedimenticolia bacterium]|jgi:exosortase H (IPTLxxWG-CTERM-specific)
MRRSVLSFVLYFGAGITLSSILIQIDAVDQGVVVPFTGLIARAGGAVLNLMGMGTQVTGTVISGERGFSVNILNGCNGVYVMAILISAVLAFPSTWKEKLVGLAIGIPGIQIVNLIRIVSLYYLGLRRPALFEEFHLYVWQAGVIILSMAIWLFWAEVLVSGPDRPPGGPSHKAAGSQ